MKQTTLSPLDAAHVANLEKEIARLTEQNEVARAVVRALWGMTDTDTLPVWLKESGRKFLA
jgi:hypothetical protein